jgi:hypothetical protein
MNLNYSVTLALADRDVGDSTVMVGRYQTTVGCVDRELGPVWWMSEIY